MGRPKRTKVATSDAPSRVSQPAVSSIVSQHASTSSPPSSGALTKESDDSERSVVKDRTGANRRGVPRQDALMSGALGSEDVGEKPLKPLRGRKRAALSRIARQADHDKAIEALKARRDAMLAGERGEVGQIQVPATQTTKTFSAQPTSIATMPTTQSANVGLRSDQGKKAKMTPLKESSIIVAAQPKKRPRQPSLLQMVQIQKVVEDSEDDSLADFEPDDISTPLQIRQPQDQGSSSFSSIQHHSSSRKRNRPSFDNQAPASQLASEHASSRPSSPPSLPDTLFNPLSKNNGPLLPLPQHPSSRSLRQPVVHSDTLAPPQSSSSPPPPNQLKNRSNHSKILPRTKKRNSRRAPAPLPPKSPTPTQTSPQRIVHPPAKALKTSTLQNFLPHRRVQYKDKGGVSTFDIPSSSEVDLRSAELDEDEDELSYHAAPTTSRKPKPAKPLKSKEKANTGGKRSVAGRDSLTYSRKKAPDKENLGVDDGGEHNNVDDDEDDDNDIGGGFGHHDEREGNTKMDSKAKAEIRRLVDKFREVDEWGLEFEEVTGSSDRMVNAR
ncbi:MAG: hypothetical protein LQ342_007643 [Letrouitia transgressa]|nr:MAG: hypothetical protein LQ342_007643 [Letrouitia transgressa]